MSQVLRPVPLLGGQNGPPDLCLAPISAFAITAVMQRSSRAPKRLVISRPKASRRKSFEAMRTATDKAHSGNQQQASQKAPRRSPPKKQSSHNRQAPKCDGRVGASVLRERGVQPPPSVEAKQPSGTPTGRGLGSPRSPIEDRRWVARWRGGGWCPSGDREERC